MSDTFKVKIEKSTVGAAAFGDRAQATGSAGSPLYPATQDEHRKALQGAQNALVKDQDALDKLDARMFEALGQFLRLAREIQVEQKSLASVQMELKNTLDEVWAEQMAKGMKPQLLPKSLEVAGAIATNPVLVEVAKKLIGA